LLVAAGVWRIPATSVRGAMTLVVEMAVAAGVALWIGRRVNVWAGGFLALVTWSMVYPRYDQHSVLTGHSIFLGAVWFALVATQSGARAWLLMDALCVVAVAHVLFLAMQTVGFDPIFKPRNPALLSIPVGLMSNRNEVSALLAFCAPAFMRPGRWWGLALVAAGLVMARSCGGVAALLAGILFLGLLFRTRYFLAVLAGSVLVAAGYVILVDAPGVDDRARIHLLAWNYYWRHPWAGSGLGHWQLLSAWLSQQYQMPWFKYLHNDLGQATFEMGAGFVVILIGYLTSVWRRYRPEACIGVTALVIIGVNSLLHFPWHIAPTALVGATWLGILENQLDGRSPCIE